MKEIYLHIGTHKTGTTALQNFFARNQTLLKEKGIEYLLPERMRKKDHRRLAMAFYPNHDAPYCEAIPGIKSPAEEWSDFLEVGSGEKLLLSSEQFFTCPPEIISKIRDITSSYNVKVICYIRRQDELEESLYNQSIKGFRCSNSLPKAMGKYETQKHFSNWENIFGPENILVRPYEKKYLYKGSLFSDFLHHVLDIELSDEFTLPPKEENTRLHRIALEYQRLINCLSMTDKQKNKFNRPMRDVSKELFKEEYQNSPVLSPESGAQVLKANESFYHSLAQQYLPDKNKSFFCDLSVSFEEDWCGYELTKHDACFINTYLANNHIELFEVLLKEIENGLDSTDPKENNAAVSFLAGVFDILICDFVHGKRKLLAIGKSRPWKILCKLRMIKNFFLSSSK